MKTSGNIATEWKRFRGQWENYVIATNLSCEDSARRAAIFLACVGTDAYELFQTLEFEDETHRKDITKIIGAFEKHCVGETNVTYERSIFNRREQDAAEPFDSFVADIRRLIRTCEYGVIENSIIRDRIVMLEKRQLDLKKAIDICKSSEATTKQLRAIAHPKDIHAVNSGRDRQSRRESSPPSRSSRSSPNGPPNRRRASTPGRGVCQYCNRRHVSNRTACSAYGKTCRICLKKKTFRVSL